MAADTEKLWSIREDGSITVDTNLSNRITYNASLNALILFSDNNVTVIDALSGAFLQQSDLSGKSFELPTIFG